MIIQCEKCKRKFKVEDSEITTPESKVRCSNCGYAFSAGNKEISYGEDSIGNEQEDFLPDGEEENELTDFTDKLDADTVTDDGGNWEEFVSISKTEEKTEDLEINHSPDTGRGDRDFNWDNLRIDHEHIEIPDRSPQLFEDEDIDTEQRERKVLEEFKINENPDRPHEEETQRVSYQRKSPETLAIDMEVLSNNPRYKKGFSGVSGQSSYQSLGIHPSRSKSGGGIFGGIAYGIIAAAVLIVIITASYIILLNTGVIPKETANKIRNLAQSIIPLELSERGRNDVIITEHTARWMNTRNGPLYIVSGTITNRAPYPVHFVKIHSEFLSAGQVLFENDVYAGNTFTENELKVSPLQDILLKLKKKNGNIDYYNTNKLAGLNYNIQPGESIPFYTVFLPQSRVLGLKYNLRIADYEDSVSN